MFWIDSYVLFYILLNVYIYGWAILSSFSFAQANFKAIPTEVNEHTN